ncbi:hypothetical protein [Sabulibacter ruber]|uniref:hypothetical protein n=1 Tax=Sabulibacter ruber TaxID=2811901 RepID=UPI001A969653|nr:hypothetical protein [Sabulibacter ruber]
MPTCLNSFKKARLFQALFLENKPETGVQPLFRGSGAEAKAGWGEKGNCKGFWPLKKGRKKVKIIFCQATLPGTALSYPQNRKTLPHENVSG